MEPHHYSFIKLFTLSLPLLCLLSWIWPAASTTSPPPSSALLAADILRTRGYSLFGSMVVSLSTTANFSGTLLAPPDFAFSPTAAAKFLNSRRPTPRPSISLLLYHTIRPPLALAWPALSSRDDGYELHTLYNNNCLYLSRGPYGGGDISLSPSPYNKNPLIAVKIRQPDLYVDANLTVHGIDGVLDPSLAVNCKNPFPYPTVDGGAAPPPRANRTFLDHAMRALRRTGYNVAAAAMAIRRSELLSLTSVTVFAVSDENLFLKPGGFRFNFRHHVVPMRRRFADLASVGGATTLETLAPNKTVLVNSVDGAVSVDGVAVDKREVYRNRWIIVMSVMASLDDVVVDYQFQPSIDDDSFPYPAISKSPSPSPAILAPEINPAGPDSIGSQSPAAADLDGEIDDNGPATVPTISSSSPATDEVNGTNCDLSTIASIGVEGGDLLCPVSTVRRLLEMGDDVDGSRPSDALKKVDDEEVKIVESVNIADDVFFYI